MFDLLRSLLFAPADKPSVAEKLVNSGADAVVLDLEDAIPAHMKAAARDAAHAAVQALVGRGPAVLVRVNPADSPWFVDDVIAVARMGADGVVVPKVEDHATVQRVSSLLVDHGTATVRIIAGLETVRGIMAGAAVLARPVVGCYFGAEDYVADVGGRRTDRGDEVLVARSMVVIAAHVAGVPAIDQAVIDFEDSDRFRRDATVGRNLGYSGKICIHPRQVALANASFGVSKEELAMSQYIVDRYERVSAEGVGVFVIDGEMIDEPMVRRARASLARSTATASLRVEDAFDESALDGPMR